MKYLKRVVQEMVPVILGILIALFINNWKEDQANQQFVEQAFTTIRTEIAENANDLDGIVPRHLELLERMTEELNNDTLSLLEVVGSEGGVQLATIKSAAWKFFLNSRTDLIDYKVASALVEMDEGKRMLEVKFDKFLTYCYDRMDDTSASSKKKFIVYFSNVLDSEMHLQELYQTYLDQNPLEPEPDQ